VPPVAAKRIGGVVAAAERARHQVRRADRPRSGRPPRGDWSAVAPLAVGAVLRGNPCADKTSGSPCLSVRVRTTSVFLFGIRPSVGKIAPLALALLQLGKDAVGARVAPQLHRRPDAGERVVHGRLFEPGQASVARRASAEFPLAIERGRVGTRCSRSCDGRTAGAPTMAPRTFATEDEGGSRRTPVRTSPGSSGGEPPLRARGARPRPDVELSGGIASARASVGRSPVLIITGLRAWAGPRRIALSLIVSRRSPRSFGDAI
jgi:hypothetical protein